MFFRALFAALFFKTIYQAPPEERAKTASLIPNLHDKISASIKNKKPNKEEALPAPAPVVVEQEETA